MFCSKTQLLLIALIVIITLSIYPSRTLAQSVSGNESNRDITNNEALSSFHHAMGDANERLQRFRQKRLAIALTQTSEDINGNVFQQNFIPEAYSEDEIIGSWQTIKVNEQFDESIVVTDSLFLKVTTLI